jgi:hypothetical protein
MSQPSAVYYSSGTDRYVGNLIRIISGSTLNQSYVLRYVLCLNSNVGYFLSSMLSKRKKLGSSVRNIKIFNYSLSTYFIV